MQVAVAGGAQPTFDDGANAAPPKAYSSAPLYLSTSLRDIAFDIEALEQYALDRLRLLKAIESARTAAHLAGPKSTEARLLKTNVRQLERMHELHVPPKGTGEYEDRLLKDEASHFLLRLALCREHEHRLWLLQAECVLFAARLEGGSTEQILAAVKRSGGPKVLPVSRADLEAEGGRLRRELDEVQRGVCHVRSGAQGMKFFRVPFESVPFQVGRRRVLVKRGEAYVPENNLQDTVCSLYRKHLSHGLTVAARAATIAEMDKRMRPILNSVRQHYTADTQTSGFDENDAERINLRQLEASLPAMPLCMQHMISKLKQHHHLRHSARMQLGVFLKGCGLTMDESLHFWKSEFGKGNIDSNKFDKQYAYNIRHYYGQEGKRKSLKPFPCMKIINDRPGPSEYNGCPYRELQEHELAAELKALNVNDESIKAITSKAKENNFQVACGMCFHATQPVAHNDEEIQGWIPSHPNDYFIQARKRRLARRGVKHEPRCDDDDGDMPMTDQEQSQSQSEIAPSQSETGENPSVPRNETTDNTPKPSQENGEIKDKDQDVKPDVEQSENKAKMEE